MTDYGLPLWFYFPTIHLVLSTYSAPFSLVPIVLISANISHSTLVGIAAIRSPCIVAILGPPCGLW